jgi:hypothetical protein
MLILVVILLTNCFPGCYWTEGGVRMTMEVW